MIFSNKLDVLITKYIFVMNKINNVYKNNGNLLSILVHVINAVTQR